MSSNYLEIPKQFFFPKESLSRNHLQSKESPGNSDSRSSSPEISSPDDNQTVSETYSIEKEDETQEEAEEHWLDRAITPLILNENEGKNPILTSITMEAGKRLSSGDLDLDYKEAALIIWEGESNAKFYRHPTTKWSKRAYAILNNPFYHFFHFTVCNILLLLAVVELPSVEEDFITMDLYLKYLLPTLSAVELACLSILFVHVFLHVIWLKKNFFRYRIAIVFIILVEMYIEVLVIVILERSHMRLDRALRPILLLDAYYLSGVRRIIRQTFEILSHILDVVFLLIYFILVMALIGYILFGFLDPGFFLNYARSFMALLVTSTTANDPTVMLEAYSRFIPTPIFFVIYFVLTLYFAANTLLAVVYSSYSEAVRKKFKKLFFHKRDALYQVFCELSQDNAIQFHDFLFMMLEYRPRMPEWQVMCIFKALHKNRKKQQHDLGLSLEEFMHFYDILGFSWTQVNESFHELKWYSNLSSECLRNFIEGIDYMVSLRIYKFIMGIIVVINLSFLIICLDNLPDPRMRIERIHQILPGTFVFLSIYSMDIICNLIASGMINYLSKLWNVADVIVIGGSLICAILNYYVYSGSLIAFVIPIKLFRLVKIKRSYRDLLDTLIEVSPRLFSFFLFIVILYYSYSIIGMEILFHKVYKGCCKDALFSVGKYYQGAIFPSNISLNQTENVYYIENFNNILRSYVTLYYEMIVNNWYIIVEGFASTFPPKLRWWSRVYFITFYLTTLVMLQMLIALMVDAFVSKMQTREAGRRDPENFELKRNICYPENRCDCSKNVCCCPENVNYCPQEKVSVKKTVIVTLVKEDFDLLRCEVAFVENGSKRNHSINKIIRNWRRRYCQLAEDNIELKYVGSRPYTDIDVHRLQYEEDIKEWIKEYYRDDTRRESSLKMQPLCNRERICSFCQSVCDFLLG